MDCIFCKIIEEKIPHNRIYEDEIIIAFLDINPLVKGHTLIIPKKHSRWLWDMNDEDYSYIMKKTKYLAEVLKKTFSTDWIEIIVAGVGVEHTHIHIMPRTEEDGQPEVPTQPLEPKLSKEEMQATAEKIKQHL